MNVPIRRVAIVAMIMFLALLINVTQISVFQAPGLNAHPMNRRARDAEFAQDRGPIIAGGEPIAESVKVDSRFAFQRTYPNGPLYAPVTGYFSYDHASVGLEAAYTEELAGTASSLFVRRMVDLVTGRKPKGASVETTIVPGAQRVAAERLGNRKGAVVAIDPDTGAVLAMVTHPSYDPNAIAGHDIATADENYRKLADDPGRPMANRATREIYPPGSVFKLVTAAAALENGMEPNTQVESPASLTLPNTNTQLGNSTNCGGSKVTIDKALQTSCNTAFANIGLDLGADALREQAIKFGFGKEPLPDLDAVASRFPDDMDGAQLAMSSIGQYEVATSPLQMAMVTAGIANDGVVMEPYVVNTVRAPNLTPLYTHQPREMPRAMTTDNARKLQDMMVNVVESGTGTNARLSGVRVGGKTGTAQSAPERPPYAWFVAFGEVDGRKVAVAVFVEEADIPRNDIAGGRLAAPIARAVIQELLQ
ncbi:peptidoglycan D,D-transpeptidase FtsI family protein [Enemella sp. A6]|uniref:peptidoglycan D,D-transpeptidase FtsI family protein n=1 Tax=Enemella sp. A6 TaxID=3440152 RepID=UPI003EBCA37A